MSRLVQEVRRASSELASDAAARSAIETVTNAIAAVAAEGQPVTIKGFGTFKVKDRAARMARNPRTGEQIAVAGRKVLTFKPLR